MFSKCARNNISLDKKMEIHWRQRVADATMSSARFTSLLHWSLRIKSMKGVEVVCTLWHVHNLHNTVWTWSLWCRAEVNLWSSSTTTQERQVPGENFAVRVQWAINTDIKAQFYTSSRWAFWEFKYSFSFVALRYVLGTVQKAKSEN